MAANHNNLARSSKCAPARRGYGLTPCGRVEEGRAAHDIGDPPMNARYDPRADKITVAITEAIIAIAKG